MFKGKTDHIVLACTSLDETRKFYEEILQIKPETVLPGYVTYPLGSFSVCFRERSDILNPGASVMHIGLEFPLQSDVDRYRELLLKIKDIDPGPILGGISMGPYRFYVKDPSGYTIEFESWENSSD